MLIAGFLRYQLKSEVGQEALFVIPAGSNLSRISKELKRADLLPADESVFKALALLTRDEGTIRAGQYRITQTMTVADLLALFRSGTVVQHKITFPEGITVDQWLQQLREAPYLAQAQAINRSAVSANLGIEGDPEGWLFPDTYQYAMGDSAFDVLRLAYKKMQGVLQSEWDKRGALKNINDQYDILILASLIEKETGYGPDREKIASVFHNRMATAMKLQTDPTVIYGMGDEFSGDLKRIHLRKDTPYNTYTRHGLPPTPICSPGLASISAAVIGSQHPYFYFVAKGDGKSAFSVNLEDHNKAVNTYQRSIIYEKKSYEKETVEKETAEKATHE
jgi:UPF0755 protein